MTANASQVHKMEKVSMAIYFYKGKKKTKDQPDDCFSELIKFSFMRHI